MKTKIAILFFVASAGMFSVAAVAQAQDCRTAVCQDAREKVMVFIEQQAPNPSSVKFVTTLAAITLYGDIGVYVKYFAKNGSGSLVLRENMFGVSPNGEVHVIQ